ncbi:type 1 glutamine amidotransferase [Amnibacterium flavum]|uniref:Lipid II isoglutaminyl synthase (glutamine-hydrolyzing) subunit GatD n=1 Tax=Amnibacterium flavum TaxID=2173173 RepID=A0A2V1HVA8_9MICO|nr:cobyric acid synthase [Amnibacterium flavum]PVZ94267.1 cobyric acid synthase [Amnibacterium flavum]
MSAILQLFPELTNVNGDAENALVLARRAQWVGIDAEPVPVPAGGGLPTESPVAVVLGSGVDSALEQTRDALLGIREALDEWIAAGIPILAVGTGFELLTASIELEGRVLDGLAVLPGRATPLETRAAGEVVVASTWGELIGYENHARGYRSEGAATLGAVQTGVGNGDGTEGVVSGSVFGTHLHGPILARNPSFAIAILTAAFGDDGDLYAKTRADGVAEAIRVAALRRARTV